MFNPVASYRIQFNKNYTFRDFLKDAGYLSELGVSSIYASPVFGAVPGSMHGYDVTDPMRINPEIGTPGEFAGITDKLKSLNIGWVQDIVPNHMAFHNNNIWLMDVLEKGKGSEYARFFDIDFSHPESEGKIVVPFLGKTPEEALNDNEIVIDRLNGKPVFRYFDYWFPLSAESAGEVKAMGPSGADKKLMERLLSRQHYVLCYWKDSLNRLNYRRFFTVNSLICLNMQLDEVFEKYHSFILELVKQNRVNGLRVDHIDGLQSPAKYLDRLRLHTGGDTYIIVEKILEQEEDLPLCFPINGTSGYDYLGIVNNLFTRTDNYSVLKSFYEEITGIRENPEELIYSRKKLILTGSMNGEWENLARLFDESGFVTYSPAITRESVKEAIGEFLVLFPVYKIYGDSFPLPDGEADIIKDVFRKAREKNPGLKNALDAISDIFLKPAEPGEEKRDRALSFLLRCLQFTGPLMAKGIEDTVMYYYNCFICHNEVGDNPFSRGISAGKYHDLMISRQRNRPMSMNATSTHDTKRGEDVRARLNILSEIPGEWIMHVREWMKMNGAFRREINGKQAPGANEEYFIYQTLTGAFPMDGKTDSVFLERMDQYLEKALREGKTNSDWNDPDEEYEKAVKEFTRNILATGSMFLKSFVPFLKKVSSYGIINSLSQLLLKAASPGIPDFYQGTELWDLSLVDPDNRRPVDYALRNKMLSDLRKQHKRDPGKLLDGLVKNMADGRIKLWMTHILLEERKTDRELFMHGSYIPLKTEGKFGDHVLAFARVHKSSWFIAAVPLFITSLNPGKKAPVDVNWEDTSIILPGLAPLRWSVSSGERKPEFNGKILLADIMKFPVPVFLKARVEAPSRFAGVLAHISSLPGKYGTGDLGDEAYDFADILQRNGQSYWQVLPLNPVDEGYGWSPYSSASAFAGNTMFISPGMLVRANLVSRISLKKKIFAGSSAGFNRAVDFRNLISDEAFTNFFCRERPYLHADFDNFCKQQEFWLGDFVLFNILKREYKNVPWNEWPENFLIRDRKSLEELSYGFESDIKREKFMQYIFNRQWLVLKSYCNNKGIELIGDMSLYVNYDSAEVWAHPEYFKLDAGKKPITVAGVPPDYFSETGQLWNTPVYDWDRMRKDGYSWWINRIKRNLELSDLVRFDHFRAFSEYWEVPYGEETAVNGQWTAGPGRDFFETVRREYPAMPFIVEDLGSTDEKVYKLRDDFGLPGMAVLQFAFGDNTARSAYIPHNFIHNCIVYTGTHDNNTIRGWYMNELGDRHRKEASEYVGHTIKEETCHEDFIRMAYGSVAKIAVIPVQDLLGLDESARLNKPSTFGNNWTWRMRDGDMEKMFSPKIRKMVKLYWRT